MTHSSLTFLFVVALCVHTATALQSVIGTAAGIASLVSASRLLFPGPGAPASSASSIVICAGLALLSLVCVVLSRRKRSLLAELGLLRRAHAPPVYTLNAMAGDCLQLLDHLHVARAHVVGVSMGGMVAQCLAAAAPHRVRSLTSVMSTTGRLHPALAPSLLFLARLFLMRRVPPADDAEANVRFMMAGNMLTGTGAHDDTFNAGLSRRKHFEVSISRQIDRTGVVRQVGAIETVRQRVQC